jgi:hypothetical protein
MRSRMLRVLRSLSSRHHCCHRVSAGHSLRICQIRNIAVGDRHSFDSLSLDCISGHGLRQRMSDSSGGARRKHRNIDILVSCSGFYVFLRPRLMRGHFISQQRSFGVDHLAPRLIEADISENTIHSWKSPAHAKVSFSLCASTMPAFRCSTIPPLSPNRSLRVYNGCTLLNILTHTH